MKICTICDDHFPSYWTSTNQVITTASYMGRIGVDVDLMIPILGKNLLMSKERRLRKLCEYYGVEPTFNLKDFFSFWPTNRFRIEKLTHGILSPIYANFGKYDLIYTRHILPVFLTLAAGGKAIFETYRLLPEEFPQTIPLLKWICKNDNFLGITTHSELSRQAFIEAGVPPEKVIALHNGYDPHEFEPRLSKTDARELLGISQNRFLAVYTGHMTSIKGVEVLVDIAEKVPEIDFLLIGGPTKDDVERISNLAKSKGITNVEVTGWVNPHMVPPYLYAADVLLIPPTSKPLEIHKRTVLPIKVFNYLAAGRVIFAPDLPDTAELLQHGVNSYRVEPDNIDAAAEGLRVLAEDTLLADSLADRAYKDSKQFTWEERARKLRAYMEERLNASI
jgi:glycosyltransferase involved in cell wall biosynthesis